MPFGFHDNIARVNLTDRTVTFEHPGEVFFRRYFGGWNIVAHYLLAETKPGVDPLGPDNLLIFAAGVLGGVPISGPARHAVGAKSPLTGGFGEGDCGGFWAAELKRAGLDGIVIKGKADQPVYLWVHDGEVEIRDASHLWGKFAKETQQAIRDELGDQRIRVSLIGPAGEHMVRVACVMNDLKDAAGRTGMGAVMGSKNLKAVAVRGSRGVEVANPEKVQDLARYMGENATKIAAGMHDYGTGREMDSSVVSGNLPTRNFRDAGLVDAMNLDARTIAKTIRVGMEACYACAVRCKKIIKVDTGPYIVDPDYGGTEYETAAALGSNCGIVDAVAVAYGSQLCNAYTLDTIATGNIIAFAMECFENGLLTLKDTDGIDLRFGNVDAMVKMVEKIGKAEEIGKMLGEGVKRAAAQIGQGAEKYAVHVKGGELPYHEPRLKRGLGLGYMISPTGADHCHSLHDMGMDKEAGIAGLKALGILEPMPSTDLGYRKVRAVAYTGMLSIFNNCALLCNFVPWNHDQRVELVRAVTGWNTTLWELIKVGERGLSMARAFNMREGLTAADDVLPPRIAEPHTSGNLANAPADMEGLDRAKHIYYGIMGWDEETGVPTRAKLTELDVPWIAEQLA